MRPLMLNQVESHPVCGDDAAVDWVGDAGVLGKTGLLERSAQLTELDERFADVTDCSQGRMVLVRGEAGIGKTALLRRFCDGLGAGVRILWAACDPLITPRPLGPLLDIAPSVDGGLAGLLDRGAKPHEISAAMMSELEFPAPTVLVIEDLHWADEATLDVVRLLARRVNAIPVLFVVSFRGELPRAHPLRIFLGELASGGVVTRFELTGLSRTAVAALARNSALDVDVLYDRTAGNPLFVTETLAAGVDGVPTSIRDAVLARAARLTAAARAVLDAVAVVPQRTEVWLLEALVEGALEGLDECLSSGMLTAEVAGVSFRHELARLAIEESLAPDRAVALHRRAIAALAEPSLGPPDHARLAHHAEAAGDAAAVLAFAPLAAKRAEAVGAPREAQDQYERALRFGHGLPPEERAELLERFSDMGYLTDMRGQALKAAAEALAIHRARGDLIKQGEVLCLQSRLLRCIGRMAESETAALEAIGVLEQLPRGGQLALAYAAGADVAMMNDDEEATMSWGIRAIALAERFDNTEALVRALNSVGTTEWSRGADGSVSVRPAP